MDGIIKSSSQAFKITNGERVLGPTYPPHVEGAKTKIVDALLAYYRRKGWGDGKLISFRYNNMC